MNAKVITICGEKFISGTALLAAASDPQVIATSAALMKVGHDKGESTAQVVATLLASYAAHVAGDMLCDFSAAEVKEIMAQLGPLRPAQEAGERPGTAIIVSLYPAPDKTGTRVQVALVGKPNHPVATVYANAVLAGVKKGIAEGIESARALGFTGEIAAGGKVPAEIRRAIDDTPQKSGLRHEPGSN